MTASEYPAWIKDRLPTEDDADHRGHVWAVLHDNEPYLHSIKEVSEGQPWTRTNRPPPYKPPEPVHPKDVPVSALPPIKSIDDMEGGTYSTVGKRPSVSCGNCHREVQIAVMSDAEGWFFDGSRLLCPDCRT